MVSTARLLQHQGSCMLNGANGLSDAANGFREGNVSATARLGAGTYRVTLQAGDQADNKEHVALVSLQGAPATSNGYTLTWTSDSQLDIVTNAGGVPADVGALKVVILKVR